MNEEVRVRCKAARVCIESADEMVQDSMKLHAAGEHEAAAMIDQTIGDMHDTALRHLEAATVPELPDDDAPPEPDEYRAQRARFARH